MWNDHVITWKLSCKNMKLSNYFLKLSCFFMTVSPDLFSRMSAMHFHIQVRWKKQTNTYKSWVAHSVTWKSKGSVATCGPDIPTICGSDTSPETTTAPRSDSISPVDPLRFMAVLLYPNPFIASDKCQLRSKSLSQHGSIPPSTGSNMIQVVHSKSGQTFFFFFFLQGICRVLS